MVFVSTGSIRKYIETIYCSNIADIKDYMILSIASKQSITQVLQQL